MLSLTAPGGRLLIFGGVFSAVGFVSWVIVNSHLFSDNEAVLSVALAVDMAVAIPAVYYLLIRKTTVPPFSTAFVFFASIVLAGTIIPEDQETLHSILMVAPAPIELFLIAFIGYEARKIARLQRAALSGGGDFVDSLRGILREQIKNDRVADILTTEISIISYALTGWNESRADSTRFTYHRKSGYTAIAWAFVLVIVIEATAVHFLIVNWSIITAWILTGLSSYSVVFLLGDLNGIRQRHVAIDGTSLYLRVGLRWNATIPLEQIESVEPVSSRSLPVDILSLRIIGDPNILLRFTSTQRAIGLYGITKTFKEVLIAIDERGEFIDAIERRLSLQIQ